MPVVKCKKSHGSRVKYGYVLGGGIRKRQERSKLCKGLVMLPGAKLKSLNHLLKFYRRSDGFKQESDCMDVTLSKDHVCMCSGGGKQE